MLAAIRAFAKSPFAVLLMGLLIVSFAVWGVRDAFKTSVSNWVIKAGSHEVSAAEYKHFFDRAVRNESERVGRGVTNEEALAAGADRAILSQMSDESAIGELVRRIGVIPDDKLVLASIARNPAFTDPLTGRFSQKAYRATLQQNEVQPEPFERSLRDGIAGEQVSAGLGGGLQSPRIYAALMASYLLENRGADYVVLDEHSVPAPAKPTDAQLLAYLKENAAMLKRPEFRTLSLVRFSAQAVAPTLTADPALVQKTFDKEKERLAVPERRAFVQIILKDPAQAAAAAGRLAKGEAPAAVAKAYGATATPYPATSQRAIPDPQVASAVFALQPGQSSGPIRGDFGVAVVKLTTITPAKAASLDDVRGKIEAEVNAEAAQQKVFDQMQKYGDAHDSGAPMAKAAETAGMKVYTLGPLTAQGVDVARREKIQALTPKMLAEAFSLPQGGETEVQDLGKSEYYAIRVEHIQPSALPDLNEVRAPLTTRVMQVDVAKRLQARADALNARLQKGEALDKLAASEGLTVRHVQGLSRATASQRKDLGQEFLGKVLSGKPGESFIALGADGVTVGRIGPATSANLGQVAMLSAQAKGQLAQMQLRDLSETLRTVARERIKPKVNMARARTAIGLDANDSGAPAKPAKAGG